MNLVLQSPSLEEGLVPAVARLAGTTRVEKIAERVWRLRDAAANDSIAAFCETHEIDHAFVPEGRRFAELKLLAMDMDSTLITIECIDELGELAGKKREVAAITAQAMRGEIDYSESLRRRVALLQGLEESALGRVYDERLRLTPGADRLLAACKKHGMAVVAYVPIARGKVPGNDALERIGKAHGKSAAQVSLRYLTQQGLVPIPRTANPAHLKENLDVFDWRLSDAEMAELKKLNATNMRVVNPPHAPKWDS